MSWRNKFQKADKRRMRTAINTYDKVSQAVQSTVGNHQRRNRSSFEVSVKISLAIQSFGDALLIEP
jgi:hypothetical protein